MRTADGVAPASAVDPAVPPLVSLQRGRLRVTIDLSSDLPARIVEMSLDGSPSILAAQPLVEVLTAQERHERMTLGYTGSAIGGRLRPVRCTQEGDALALEQFDRATGLQITTHVALTGSGDGIRVWHRATNGGEGDLVVFALSTLSARTAAAPEELQLTSGRSEWLGEGRWSEASIAALLPDLGFAAVKQPDRTGFGQSSSGGWPTGSVLPTAVLSAPDGTAVGWQIESSAGWQWSLSRGDGGVVLSAGGPTEREHHGEVRLRRGETFDTVTAGLVVSDAGRDGAFAALTRHRRGLRTVGPADRGLPVIYNDYMNTLMGQPTTEALLPLIAAAAEAGAEYFCIDAGWFTDSTDYWSEVGEWREAPTRFTGGLRAVTDAIRDAGMKVGLWIEPESVGCDSPVSESLPPGAFFQRAGAPVIEQRRKHLDLRHPAARAHLDEVVDRLVREFDVSYLKLDYNIEPGSGTDVAGLSPGIGLLEHTRALRDWLVAVQQRHPGLLLENCASGAMRMDYHLLAVTHVQSTSDQQDAGRYAAIAASAPASVLPEQAGNWAYPAVGMSRGELATTLVSGLSGRLYLAGFLSDLDPSAFTLVQQAVALAKSTRTELMDAMPFWPAGLPQWDDDILVLGLRMPRTTRVFVWSRGLAGRLRLPGVAAGRQIFPGDGAWPTRAEGDDWVIDVPAGSDAAVFEIREGN